MKGYGKLIALTTFLFVAAEPALAKCKFKKERTDKETGETIRTTKWDRFKMMAIDGAPGAWFAGQSRGDAEYLVLKFEEQKTHRKSETRKTHKGRATNEFLSSFINLAEGSKFLILLADESIVELEAESVDNVLDTWGPPIDWDDYALIPDEVSFKSSTTAFYRLDDEKLAQLTAHGYTDLRVTTNHGDRDISKRKPAKEIQAVLGCITGSQE